MTDKAKPQAHTEAPTYEAAREELSSVVHRLENGGLSLEESLALWERGEELARICQAWLDGARERLTAAMRESDHNGGDLATNGVHND